MEAQKGQQIAKLQTMGHSQEKRNERRRQQRCKRRETNNSGIDCIPEKDRVRANLSRAVATTSRKCFRSQVPACKKWLLAQSCPSVDHHCKYTSLPFFVSGLHTSFAGSIRVLLSVCSDSNMLQVVPYHTIWLYQHRAP